MLSDSDEKSHFSVRRCYNFYSTSGVSLGLDLLFAQLIADRGSIRDTCLKTVIILAFLSSDASDKEIHTSPVKLNTNCHFNCCFIDAEAKAFMKERQKKDNHNLSEFEFLQILPAVSFLSLRSVITMCT